MSIFGFDNKYGRPIPYVWFLIIAVSSIPYMLFGGVEGSIDCKTIGSGYTPDSYYKEHGITIQEGKAKCDQLISQIDIIKPIASGIMFGLLIWQLKPYPFSSANEEKIDTKKDDSRSPIK